MSTSRASSDTQAEIVSILQIIRSEQKKTNSRADDTNKRIDAFYAEYDEEEYDENQNYDIDYYDDETGDEVPNHDNTSTNDSVSVDPPRKKAEIRYVYFIGLLTGIYRKISSREPEYEALGRVSASERAPKLHILASGMIFYDICLSKAR